MEFRENRATVDTSHPSVHLTFSTSTKEDVFVRDRVARNDVECVLKQNITGTDELKIGYVVLSKASIPVSWWNVTGDSAYIVNIKFLNDQGLPSPDVGTNGDDHEVETMYIVVPTPNIWGGLDRISFCNLHREPSTEYWQWVNLNTGARFLANAPFSIVDIGLSPGSQLYLSYHRVAEYGTDRTVMGDLTINGNTAYGYMHIWSVDDFINNNYSPDPVQPAGILPRLLGMSSQVHGKPNHEYAVASPDAFGIFRDPGFAGDLQALGIGGFLNMTEYDGGGLGDGVLTPTLGIPDFNPVKMIRIVTDIAHNTPQVSTVHQNPIEVVPTSANMGDWITYEATTPFQLQVPGINLVRMRVRLLDQDGKDINFRGKDWFFSLHVHFVSRHLRAPAGGLVKPMRSNPHPLAKRSRETYFEPQPEVEEEDKLPDRRKLLLGSNVPRNRMERSGMNVASQST